MDEILKSFSTLSNVILPIRLRERHILLKSALDRPWNACVAQKPVFDLKNVRQNLDGSISKILSSALMNFVQDLILARSFAFFPNPRKNHKAVPMQHNKTSRNNWTEADIRLPFGRLTHKAGYRWALAARAFPWHLKHV